MRKENSMEFGINAVSGVYDEYDKILQKYQLKVITTKELLPNTIQVPYKRYIQHRSIIINSLGELLELISDLKKEIIIDDEELHITIYDDYIE